MSDEQDRLIDIKLRRAVSTAYYAVFHTLARSNADLLVPAALHGTNWLRVYRALDHAVAKRVLSQVQTSGNVRDLTYFAGVFVGMQEKRHIADYDPNARFDLDTERLMVAVIREACRRFARLAADIRLDLATQLLFKPRP